MPFDDACSSDLAIDSLSDLMRGLYAAPLFMDAVVSFDVKPQFGMHVYSSPVKWKKFRRAAR